MSENFNYKLANIQKKEMRLRTQRHEIIVSESEKALDMILEAPAPATLIQSFPDQDLYYLMQKIGPYDFIPVLSMANSKQWEYILDVETWDNDRLDLGLMTKTFDLLFQADPARLLRWIIKEKTDYFEFYLFKNMEIFVREHDELPPENFNDYMTLDDKFYFRFPENLGDMDEELPDSGNLQEASELIEKMVKAVARMDLSVYHGLLLETASILPAETEEEQFRLKNLRLAEKGFLPAHEALGIYQPTKLSSLRKRPEKDRFNPAPFDPDIPLPPQFFSQFIEGDDLFVKSLKLLDPEFILNLESELAALINKVISADKIKLRSREDLEKAIIKACDYINLGLEVILKLDKKPELAPELAKGVIHEYFLEDIFRTGSRAGIQLRTKAFNWFKQSFMNKNNLPLSFLGQDYLGVIGGLFLDRPMYYDNYAKGKLYRNFKSVSDITRTSRVLEQIIAIDKVLGLLNIDINSFKQGVLTYKTLILTLWAKDRLHLESTLDPIDTKIFKNFFIALFSKSDPENSQQIQLNDLVLWTSEAARMNEKELPKAFKEVLTDLIDELEEEYALVDPKNIDPRFIPHFLLKNK